MTDGGGSDDREPDPDAGSEESGASPPEDDWQPGAVSPGEADAADEHPIEDGVSPSRTRGGYDGSATEDSLSREAEDRGSERREPDGRDPGSRQQRSQGESNRPPVRGDGAADEGDVSEWVLLVRDVATSVGAVLLVGVYLFAISGVWPPMVAIESGSMQPNMDVNDLVFVMETGRFQPDAAQGDTGVVTARDGREVGYSTFGGPGDVIVFAPNGNRGQTPIIHRAMFYVEEGENWVDKANSSHLGAASSCSDLRHVCPARNDGFITKGDNNGVYDQVQTNDPVKPEWIVGTAETRVPGLGWLRLRFQ